IGLLSSISRGNLSYIGEAADILYAYGWLTYHNYLVLEFSFLRQKEIGFSTEYFCSQIENTFGNCVAFSAEDVICCVMNLTLTDEVHFMDKLPYFLRDNLCKAGLSNPCENFFSLHTSFSQARQALMLGQQHDPHFWSYRFSDYTFQYLLMQNTREYAPSQVIHPALTLLKKHDGQKGTGYFQTLKVFLENNMNASQTAKALYIHRSTFLQRLEQIEKLTRIDLRNMQERAYLQLSFILDEQE
ncbi:MAG: PucR family transcriptional regulator, partial [Lachnospiraceae bacterium]